MRFAIIDGTREEAKHGLKGFCPGCFQPVTAKCGERRVHHWAHSRNSMCDSWWEPETEWHRVWKNNFPNEWQEFFFRDEITNEKHIADIRTPDEIIVEFQHSHITPDERSSRETFYKNMIWVVDGTRLKRDFPRFQKVKNVRHLVRKDIFRIDYPEEYFPASWLDSTVPVIFDFQGNGLISDNIDMRCFLYCIFPVRIGSSIIMAQLSRKGFVESIINNKWQVRANQFINDIRQVSSEVEMNRRRQESYAINQFMKINRYPRRRLF